MGEFQRDGLALAATYLAKVLLSDGQMGCGLRRRAMRIEYVHRLSNEFERPSDSPRLGFVMLTGHPSLRRLQDGKFCASGE